MILHLLHKGDDPLNNCTLHWYIEYVMNVSECDGDFTYRKVKHVNIITSMLHEYSNKMLITWDIKGVSHVTQTRSL